MATIIKKENVILNITNSFYTIDNSSSGTIHGVHIKYDTNEERLYVIKNIALMDFVEKKVHITVEEYIKSELLEYWEAITTPSNRMFVNGFMRVDMDLYVNQYAQIDYNPYEDDLTSEILDNVGDSYSPKRYNQKLKSGLIENYMFWYNNIGRTYFLTPMQNAILGFIN